MVDLNNKEAIASIDKSNAYSSVSSLALQCEQAWGDTQKINFPQAYEKVQNIVLCGMGGSAYSALIIKALFQKTLSVPFELVNGYDLPKYVNENTLVILSSYSGLTEEILSCAEQALLRNAKITAVTSGSKLVNFVKTNNFPAYIFDPKYNPAKQPRLGQGYMVIGSIGILVNMGFLNLSNEKVSNAIQFIKEKSELIESLAKQEAEKFLEKIPVIVAAEHLAGNAHTMRNQFNENAKNFAAYSIISELNHHLMEGLGNPKERVLTFLFLTSSIYSPVIQKRFMLTKDVVEKSGTGVAEVRVLGTDALQQMLFALSFGGYITFYLSILYNEDPSTIQWVDYFKVELAKS